MSIRSSWLKLYKDRWNGEIVPDSMSHPAKFSRGLIRKIYEHATNEGWISEGDTVIDPFGGISLGALDAMLNGINHIAVELEPKFSQLGNDNISMWNGRYKGKMPKWGTAVNIKGDSRKLAELLGNYVNIRKYLPPSVDAVDISISSPPFLQTSGGTNVTSTEGVLADEKMLKRHSAGNAATNAYGDSDQNLGNMPASTDGYSIAISSPPYADISQSGGTEGLKRYGTGLTRGERAFDEYGNQEGQLGRMKSKEDGFSAAISSPPYGERFNERGDKWLLEHGVMVSGGEKSMTRYGESEGQLGNMKEERSSFDNVMYADASISSPPFESVTSDRPSDSIIKGGLVMGASSMGDGYGDSDGQLGNDTGDDFWIAAREIVDQVYSVLKPGGHAIWVCKKFVKNKKLVNFDWMWIRVCRAAGFELCHVHRAWVVESRGAQYSMSGDLIQKTVQRKSFFRLLAEKRGAPRIDYETVICMRKPM